MYEKLQKLTDNDLGQYLAAILVRHHILEGVGGHQADTQMLAPVEVEPGPDALQVDIGCAHLHGSAIVEEHERLPAIADVPIAFQIQRHALRGGDHTGVIATHTADTPKLV